MFFTLLFITFALSITVSFLVVSIFKKPLGEIFSRIIQDSISAAWQKYIIFATYVVGISGQGLIILDHFSHVIFKNKEIKKDLIDLASVIK